MADTTPENVLVLSTAPLKEPKKRRVTRKIPKAEPALEMPPLKVSEKMDQRTETAKSGRRTRLAKPGEAGGLPLSEVNSEMIKETKNPLAVRDQLMREFFASQKHTEEIVQSLCALVYKHH